MSQYDHLKNRLHQYKVDIDKDKLWENTSHAIPRKKRRGAALIILLAGLLISGWLLNRTDLLPLSGPKETVYSNQQANQLHLTQNQQNFSVEPASHIYASNTDAIDETSSTLKTSEIKHKQTEKLQTSKLAYKFMNDERNPFSGMRQEASHKLVTEKSSAVSNEMETGSGKNNLMVEPLSISGPEQFIFDEKEKEGINFYTGERAANLPVNYLYNDVLLLPLVNRSEFTTRSYNPKIATKKKLCLQSIQFAQSAGLSSMRIRSLDPESNLAAMQLQQKMRSLEILSTTVTATIALPENFSVVTGIRVSQHSTEMNHEWEIEERVQDDGINTIIIDENGVPQSLAGNRDVTRTTHYQAKRFTTYRQADLIAELHHRIWNGGRASIHAFVKGSFNLLYTASGSVLDHHGELKGFTKNNNPYRLESPFAIGGGLQLNYRVAKSWNLFGSIACDQFQYQISDEFTSMQFRHTGFHISLGLGYVF